MARSDKSADVSLDTSKTSGHEGATPDPTPPAGAAGAVVHQPAAPSAPAPAAKPQEARGHLIATLEREHVEAGRRGEHAVAAVLNELVVAAGALRHAALRAQGTELPKHLAPLLDSVRRLL